MSQRDEWEAEDYYPEDRKERRNARKKAAARDRSKFKKTNRKPKEQAEALHPNIKESKDAFKRGRVLAATSQGWQVDDDEQVYACGIKGLLKKERGDKKNLVAVGDFVLFEPLPDQEGVIVHVEPRRSVLSRADNLSRRKEQLIAANIDQVLITASVVSPPLKLPLIDRYIIAAQKGNMEPVVVVNKLDLLDESLLEDSAEHRAEQARLLEEARAAYTQLGIPFLEVSANAQEGLDRLKEAMQGKASVFSGQSGVGKTSLINALTGQDMAVNDVVRQTRKGSHTTTTTTLVPLESGGWCVDTPGIKSFGLWNLEQDELEAYFTEIREVGAGCKFPNCTHRHEPKCAVKEAVDKGHLSILRYQSYLGLMEALEEEHRRR